MKAWRRLIAVFPWGAPFTSCRPQRRQGRFPHRVERPIKRVAPGAGGNPTGAGGVVTNRGQSCVTRPRPPYKSGAALRRERPRARTVTAAVLPVRRGQPADDVGCAAGGRQSGRGRDESAGRASSLHTEYPVNLLGSRLRGNDERRGEETRRAGEDSRTRAERPIRRVPPRELAGRRRSHRGARARSNRCKMWGSPQRPESSSRRVGACGAHAPKSASSSRRRNR